MNCHGVIRWQVDYSSSWILGHQRRRSRRWKNTTRTSRGRFIQKYMVFSERLWHPVGFGWHPDQPGNTKYTCHGQELNSMPSIWGWSWIHIDPLKDRYKYIYIICIHYISYHIISYHIISMISMMYIYIYSHCNDSPSVVTLMVVKPITPRLKGVNMKDFTDLVEIECKVQPAQRRLVKSTGAQDVKQQAWRNVTKCGDYPLVN